MYRDRVSGDWRLDESSGEISKEQPKLIWNFRS